MLKKTPHSTPPIKNIEKCIDSEIEALDFEIEGHKFCINSRDSGVNTMLLLLVMQGELLYFVVAYWLQSSRKLDNE